MQGKVLFMTYITLADYDCEKYGKEIFERNFDFEVWNLHHIFWGERVPSDGEACSLRNIKNFKGIIEFIDCLRKYSRKQTFLFFLFPPRQKMTYYLEAIVSVMGFKYSMAFCQPYLAKWNIGRLRDDLSFLKKDYGNAILNYCFPPAFNFVASPASFREFPSVSAIRRQNNIMIHTLDYDIYLDIKNEKERLVKDKYIVFVDEDYVAHVDYKVLGVTPPFRKPDDYYEPVRKLLDKIEDLYGCRVIIAEHPRAHYCDSEMYGNREMIKGQTARLIRDAELVLCHTSTALDYIILFRKKYILIYLDGIKNFYEWDAYYIPLFKYLKITGLNISRNFDYKHLKKAISSGASVACQKYKQRFIKEKGTKDEPFFEVVAENISKYFSGNEGF